MQTVAMKIKFKKRKKIIGWDFLQTDTQAYCGAGEQKALAGHEGLELEIQNLLPFTFKS